MLSLTHIRLTQLCLSPGVVTLVNHHSQWTPGTPMSYYRKAGCVVWSVIMMNDLLLQTLMGTLYYTGSALLATRNSLEFYSSIELTLTASITFNNHPYSSLPKQDRFVVLQTNSCKIWTKNKFIQFILGTSVWKIWAKGKEVKILQVHIWMLSKWMCSKQRRKKQT